MQRKTKKKIFIIVFIIISLLAVGYFFYNQYEKQEERVEKVECTVRQPIQLYTFSFDEKTGYGLKKYKMLPSNTTIMVELTKLISIQGEGYYYRIPDFEGRDDVYAEEIIHKYLSPSDLDDYSFKTLNYYEVFPTSDYNSIPGQIKACIVDYFDKNHFAENKQWRLTSIKDRAKNIIAYGNFSGNDDDDFAILLEDQTAKSSNLIVFNKDTENNWNVIFNENYSGSPIISSFKKNKLINMGETELVASPNDGILVTYPTWKEVILYNPTEKSFKTYSQYSKEDIERMKVEREYDESEYSEEESRANDSVYVDSEN